MWMLSYKDAQLLGERLGLLQRSVQSSVHVLASKLESQHHLESNFHQLAFEQNQNQFG